MNTLTRVQSLNLVDTDIRIQLLYTINAHTHGKYVLYVDWRHAVHARSSFSTMHIRIKIKYHK